MSRRAAVLLFAAGLFVRLASFALAGMDDMKAYLLWGTRANDQGLASAYSGIYFPLQWQIFQVCAALASATGLPSYAVFRAATLVFDLGILGVLVRLLRADGHPKSHALLFWCHPTFLVFAALGYIDSQFAFFVLLTALLAGRAGDAKGFALAGLPLACAFLMKPQTQSLVATAFFYALFRAVRRKDTSVLALFLAPTVLYVAYSLGLGWGGRSIWALTLSYLETASVMPAMTANHLNLWYPVAYLVAPSRPVYFVPDTAPLFGPFSVRVVAMGLTLALLAFFAGKLEAARERPDPPRRPGTWTLLSAFSALALPMVMTNAHENHFFVAALFFVVLMPFCADLGERVALHGLLALQGLNLLGIYGLGLDNLKVLVPFMELRTPPVAAVGGALAALAFAVAAAFELRLTAGAEAGGGRRWPVRALFMGAILALQVVVVARLGSPFFAPHAP